MADDDEGGGVPDWVLTYGDMMSLLLCFFVLICAISQMKEEPKNAVLESVLEQFGDPEVVKMFTASEAFNKAVKLKGLTLEQIERRSSKNRKKALAGSKGPPGKRKRVETLRDGQRQTVGGPILFEPGSPSLTQEAKDDLKRVADQLRTKQTLIEVRGFLPPTGLSGGKGYQDALELTYKRTEAVVASLVRDGLLNREIVKVTLASPVEAATMPTLKSGEKMRERVDILTYDEASSDFGRGSIPTSD
ncbi:flagellar motor protein MotB [Planctomycetes bacterium Pan216]|uniref:Flagellar motor protein MotB n=1 Tax=Kolteria novifilia TaxID=2527975 RepID=A0A518AWY1_9BACT|nr:flagellar motor protein MotB [Planctomycetes bacterium Pan216]